MAGTEEIQHGKIALSEETLKKVHREFGSDAVFTSSFGAEDMIIVKMISSLNLDIQVATIDTGRLHQSTYDLMDNAARIYGLKLKTYFPENEAVEEMVSGKGVNLFYYSPENRKLCCHIRKVEPLGRILEGKKAWVTGIRGSQDQFRKGMKRIELDESRDIVKINPLIDWETSDVWDYIRANGIPYNKLHDQGYPSIGCEPCTRAVKPGEDERAGRWWWESNLKECGLHVPGNGESVRINKVKTVEGGN